jgi:DNA-3-methyladenine glycosylase
MNQIAVLSRNFFRRDPEVVAKELLGKRLVRRLDDEVLEGIIVETEAYYGSEDPSSRAYHGQKVYNKLMWGEPAKIFIYNVHNNWMFNIIAHESNRIGAVLVRAIEPKRGIEAMMKNRSVENVFKLTNGPGKLTKALKIDKRLNGIFVASKKSEVFVANNERDFEIESSHRIGVKKDLERKLRFFVKGNKFVSR